MTDASNQTPVTVLTGFLGAGKTTLLNRILSEDHGKNYAVVVNEFGEVGIDNDLVVGADEEIFEMNNGCVCCTVRGDLIRILNGLMRRRKRFDGIIVETTGLAFPAPVIQTFFADDDVRGKTRLDAVVTVADAKHFMSEIKTSKELQEQIVFGDIILVNKTDLVSAEELQAVKDRIRTLNPFARILETERCAVDLESILDQSAFDLERVGERLAGKNDDHDHDHDDHHHHDHVHEDHDEKVRSFVLTSDRPLNPRRFIPWLQEITQQFGPDILRLKGILSMKDDDDRFVVHGIHMILEGDSQNPWGEDEERRNRLVFIGRNLPHDLIRDGFEKCHA